jgi:segregation and condensation protein B
MSLKVKEKEEALKMMELRKELQEKIYETLPEPEIKEYQVKVEKLDEALAVDEATAKHVVEALLFSTSKPLTIVDIRRVLKGYSPSQIQKLIETLQGEYEAQDRSFRLIEVAGGFELATESKYAPWIMKLELQKRARQATASALETLAILAYKQPVTRVEIEEIRGVNCSGMIATLLEKGFIKIVGRKEVPGRPMLYGTTDKFLEHFGLKSVKDLPDISEIKDLVENAIKREELIVVRETEVENEDAIEGLDADSPDESEAGDRATSEETREEMLAPEPNPSENETL